jgi:hypothetical protein
MSARLEQDPRLAAAIAAALVAAGLGEVASGQKYGVDEIDAAAGHDTERDATRPCAWAVVSRQMELSRVRRIFEKRRGRHK